MFNTHVMTGVIRARLPFRLTQAIMELYR